MTSTIRKLDRHTIDSIAAGEVIERPASVVKELIDNALDAGASVIRLRIERGGIRLILCEDDGRGMSPEDALMAIESHATSKLVTTDDLFELKTLGFRGEALPSIAAISKLELRTRTRDAAEGIRVVVEGGQLVFSGPCGLSPGTIVTCRDLFYNTPARYKFLKSDAAEAGAVADLTGKMALTRPDVSFRLDRDQERREVLYTPGNNDLLSAIYAVFGPDVAEAMVPVRGEVSPVRVSGFVATPDAARHNRSRQIFIVNGRVIQSGTLRAAADEASKTWFMRGRFPQLVLHLSIPGNLVDINVHPQKLEMRFWDERTVFRAAYQAIRAAFEKGSHFIEVDLTSTRRTSETAEKPTQRSLERLADATTGLTDDKGASLIREDIAGFTDGKGVLLIEKDGAELAGNESVSLVRQDTTSPATPPDESIDSKIVATISDKSEALSSMSNSALTAVRQDGEALFQQSQFPTYDIARSTSIAPVFNNHHGDDTVQSSEVHSLLNARFIGVLFQTYILLDDNESLILIDQHAAHERVLYEELLQRREENQHGRSSGQMLLVPIRVHVTQKEMAFLTEEEEHFRSLGFEYEPFGGQSVVVRSVPAGSRFNNISLDPAAALRAALDCLENAHKTGNTVEDTEILHLVACKAAVKANDRLSEKEIRLLLERLTTLTNPYHCPHGRPVAVKLSKSEVEKLFGRIV